MTDFFFAKSHMGTLLEWNFFTQKKIQLAFRAYLAVQIKNVFSTIKDLPIWFFGNKGIFVSQNSYGYTSSFSRFIFRLRDNQSKMCFKLTIYWLAKLKPILENKFDRCAIYWVAKLKPILENKCKLIWLFILAKLKPILKNKFERPMVILSSSWQSIKNVLQIEYIYWLAKLKPILENKCEPMSFIPQIISFYE